MGETKKKSEKAFVFDYHKVVDGEPDLQSRRDWVEQMGVPYDHARVCRLFKEARQKAERREAAKALLAEGGDDSDMDTPSPKPKRRKAKRTEPQPRCVARELSALDSEEEAGGGRVPTPPAHASESTTNGSDSASEAGSIAAVPSPQPPPLQSRRLKQVKINSMFSAPSQEPRCSLIDD